MQTELSNCNQRLLEKTEYSFNIEKDLFVLKEQLRGVRVSCINTSQASSVQVAALQNHLNHLLKQLKDKTSGPAEYVLNLLQEYVEVQKLELNLSVEMDPRRIAELKEGLTKARADLEAMNRNLDKLECQTVNNSQILHIVSLQQQIAKLRKTGGSTPSPLIPELEKHLEKEVRHLEENGSTASKLMKPIIRLQDEIVELYRSLALLLNTHTHFTVVQRRLDDQNSLLSDLQKQKEEKRNNGQINEQISAVEQEVRQLQGEIKNLNKTLSQKPELEKQLQEKRTQLEDKLEQMKNDHQELISVLLSLQLELIVRQVEAQGERQAAHTHITDVEQELQEKSERITELLGQNLYLEENITNTMTECNGFQVHLNELLDKVEKLNRILPDSNLKQTVDIVSLSLAKSNLEDRIRSETSESKKTELLEELREKKEQLDLKKRHSKDPDLNKILTIISKLEDLRKLQSQAVEEGSFERVKDKREEVLRLISELDDSNLAKIVLKNLVLLSDETQIKKLISDLKQQADKQREELQEEVRKKDEELKRKIGELGEKDRDVTTLTKDIRDLKELLMKLKKQLEELEKTSASQLRELEKQLSEKRQELEKGHKALQDKDAELVKHALRITELLEELRQTEEEAKRRNQEAADSITDLEGKRKKQEEENKRLQDALKEATECADLKKSYDGLKAEFQDSVSKLNDTFIHQVFIIQSLTQDIKLLEDQVNSSVGNVDELKRRLQEKKAELEEAKKKMKKWKGESLRFLKLLEDMRNVNRKQEEHIQEYLAEIKRLEKNMEEMLTQLSTTGNQKSKLAIQVVFLKGELVQLNKALAGLKQEHEEKSAGLEKEIEEKNKEIAYLKRSGCGADQLKKRISDLQQELKENQQELEELRRENAAQIRELEKDLAEKNRKLEENVAELKELDSENAKLIVKLADLSEELNTAVEDRKEDLQAAQRRISGLEEKLKKKEKELSNLDKDKAECEDQLKKKQKELSDLNNGNVELEEQLKRKQKELSNLNTENTELKEQLKKKDKDLSDLKKNNAEREEQLKKKQKELSDLNNEKAELEEQLKKNEKDVSNLKKNNAELEEQLKQKEKELSNLKNNSTGVNDENERLQEEVKRLKVQVKTTEKLEEQLKEKEKEISELKNSDAVVKNENARLRATLNEQLKAKDKLEEQLKQKEREISNLKNDNADMIGENERLREDVKRLNTRVKALDKSEEQLKQKEKEISDLKKNIAAVTDENKHLQEDVVKLQEKVEKLEKQHVTVKPPVITKSLRFDLETVHRRVLVSDSGQLLRGVQYTITRPNNPGRYDVELAALTTTGFSQGMPYWEVQVKDRSCFVVGVASQQAPRKGSIRYRPSNGYWTIQKKNKQYYVLLEQPALLTLADNLNVIGILIDFSKGEVSFYNTQIRALIYTFMGNNFTQKLYPFVATCSSDSPKDWPIELLDTALPLWLNK